MQHKNLGQNDRQNVSVILGRDRLNCLLDTSCRHPHFSSPGVIMCLCLELTFLLHHANKSNESNVLVDDEGLV
jgi:hypothetical protein